MYFYPWTTINVRPDTASGESFRWIPNYLMVQLVLSLVTIATDSTSVSFFPSSSSSVSVSASSLDFSSTPFFSCLPHSLNLPTQPLSDVLHHVLLTPLYVLFVIQFSSACAVTEQHVNVPCCLRCCRNYIKPLYLIWWLPNCNLLFSGYLCYSKKQNICLNSLARSH